MMMIHHFKPTLQNSVRPTVESRNAAFLLLKLKSLAEDELQQETNSMKKQNRFVPRLVPQESPNTLFDSSSKESYDTDDESSTVDDSYLISSRVRTVSVCSHENMEPLSPLRISPLIASSHLNSPTDSVQRSVSVTELSDLFNKPPSSKLVGTLSSSPVKGVLKRKFSWKNYPELEGYLVRNREEYLQYSSQLNYTAEQKQYNNRLTQGLLDLAAEEGYIFEDFTFAAIRDRIRCYYKSFVQAVKKKKRKKRA